MPWCTIASRLDQIEKIKTNYLQKKEAVSHYDYAKTNRRILRLECWRLTSTHESWTKLFKTYFSWIQYKTHWTKLQAPLPKLDKIAGSYLEIEQNCRLVSQNWTKLQAPIPKMDKIAGSNPENGQNCKLLSRYMEKIAGSYHKIGHNSRLLSQNCTEFQAPILNCTKFQHHVRL